MSEKNDYIIASVVKALRVLKVFGSDPDCTNYTLTEISKKSSIPKAGTLRILATLESEGFVKYDEETKKYHLGLINYRLGSTAYGILDLKKVCFPILKEAAQRSNLAIHLAMLAEDEIVVIDRIWPTNQVDIMGLIAQIGGTVPIHCTGVGQVLTAYADKAEQERLISKCNFEGYSDTTVTSEEAFRQRLIEVRKKGYAINDGEHEPFLKCLTRPIFDSRGHILAAFSLSGIRSSMTEDKMSEFQAISIEVAKKLQNEF